MKIIIYFFLLTTIAFTQEQADSSSSIKIKYPSITDEGWWIGMRIGLQTKGKIEIFRGTIEERWVLFVNGEYRFKNPFSYVVEYQIFRQKHQYQSTVSALNFGFKCRIYLSMYLKVSTEGGFTLGKLGGYFPGDFYYGGGYEFFLDKKCALYSNVRTFIIPDYGYFLSLGLNYKLGDSNSEKN
jgi:hypothetical protein